MGTEKFKAGDRFPPFRWPKVGGGELDLAAMSGWRMLVVYRGKHCPLCRKYLDELERLVDEFGAHGIAVAAVSADTREKAETEAREQHWRFPVAYDLATEQMRSLGLYISDPGSPPETDRPFSEPALFVIDPDGLAHVINVSNAPYARPELRVMLEGVTTTKDKHAPIHGTMS